MSAQLQWSCAAHDDPFACPDALVHYTPRFDEFGLIVHDGGSSVRAIGYCPWCGTRLPASKRERWFQELEHLGLDPSEDEIPPKYVGSSWWDGSDDI
jgi:hypothetical protein